MNVNTLKEAINVRIHNSTRRPMLSNLFGGLGIYHAIYSEDSYLQAMIAWIAPSAYVGYHLYKNSSKIEEGLEGRWKRWK